jgi:hypothetical protein
VERRARIRQGADLCCQMIEKCPSGLEATRTTPPSEDSSLGGRRVPGTWKRWHSRILVRRRGRAAFYICSGRVPWQRFHLRPMPHGHGSLRPRRESAAAYVVMRSAGALPARSRAAICRIGLLTWWKNSW